jgi:hypothetical protein
MSDKRMIDSSDDLQRWIDGLLTSPEGKPAAPKALRAEVRRAVGLLRQRTRTRRLVVAAAVVVLICWPRGDKVADDRQLVSAPLITQQEQPAPPVATFVAGDDTIAVPIESPAPNVTILEVYPTISARRHWKRQALLESIFASTSYDGG